MPYDTLQIDVTNLTYVYIQDMDRSNTLGNPTLHPDDSNLLPPIKPMPPHFHQSLTRPYLQAPHNARTDPLLNSYSLLLNVEL